MSHCPFCKENLTSVVTTNYNKYFVRCRICDAAGPLKWSQLDAQQAWDGATTIKNSSVSSSKLKGEET